MAGSLLLFGLIVSLLYVLGPRPRLNPAVPTTHVPPNLTPAGLASWLTEHENGHDGVIGGAEAVHTLG